MIVIEDPLPEDAAEIFFVQRQTWHESYIQYLSHEQIENRFCDAPKRIKEIRKKINTPQKTKYFVARYNKKIIGFISLTKAPKNEIRSLYLIQGYQGQGIGKQLMKKGLEWFGNETIVVHVNKQNTIAFKFYEKFGFTFKQELPEDKSDGFKLIELEKKSKAEA